MELVVGGSIAAASIAGVFKFGRYPNGPVAALPGEVPAVDSVVTLDASGGPTRYRHWSGRGGPLVVLIPGISYPMECYTPLFEVLKAAGHSVLMYDVTGRGYSHSSGEPMTASLLVRQLNELLAALNLGNDEMHLIGWSMGTVVATHFCDRFPERVARLVLLGPVGAVTANKPATAKLIHAPLGIGNALATLVMPGALQKLYRAELDAHPIVDFLCDHASRNTGLVRAMVSTLRNCPELDDNRACLARLGDQARVPILVMWATKDGTVSRHGIDEMMRLLGGDANSNARLVVISGERHGFFMTRPDEVHPHVLGFLDE